MSIKAAIAKLVGCGSVAALGAILLAGAATQPARAQTPGGLLQGPPDDHAGLFAGVAPTYDIYARALVRHMDRPHPRQAEFRRPEHARRGRPEGDRLSLQIRRPRTARCSAPSAAACRSSRMLGRPRPSIDPLRFFWIGSMNRDASLAISWHTSKVKTMADLQTMQLLSPARARAPIPRSCRSRSTRSPARNSRSSAAIPNTIQASIAMEQGELDGVGYWSWSSILSSHPDWIRDKKINFLFHTGAKPMPELPDLPSIRDLARNDLDKKALEFLLAREILGRPFMAPPGLPPDRGKALRDRLQRDAARSGIHEGRRKGRARFRSGHRRRSRAASQDRRHRRPRSSTGQIGARSIRRPQRQAGGRSPATGQQGKKKMSHAIRSLRAHSDGHRRLAGDRAGRSTESRRRCLNGRLDAQFDLGLDLLLAADASASTCALRRAPPRQRHVRLVWRQRDRLAPRTHPRAGRRASGTLGPGDGRQDRGRRSIASARAAWRSTSSTAGSTRNSAMFGGTVLQGEERYRRTIEFIDILRGLWANETFTYAWPASTMSRTVSCC